MPSGSHLRLALLLVSLASSGLLAACDSTVTGGGGPGGDGGGGGSSGDGGQEESVVSGANPTTTSATTGSGDPSGPAVTSSGSGGAPAAVQGVMVPRDDDEVDFLLANSPQSCDAPLSEPPCGPGSLWLARINLPRAALAVGTYELGTAEIGIGVTETFDDCSGFGGRGWDGEPAWITVESIDASRAVITIEGAYDDVDGTWDVPLCAGVTPA